MQLPMRLGLGQFDQVTDERLRFIKQLGVDDLVFNTPILPGDTHWEFGDLLFLRMQCEDAGLRLYAIENVPVSFYDKVMLGLPGRDEQIAHMAATIGNMGRAGVFILGYHWMPNSVWRTSRSTPGRGGATGTSFDMELAKRAPLTHGREYTEEELWANYTYYMKAILPVAEEAGVRLALHPDDPPVPVLGGMPRLFRNFEGFKRAMEIGDSPMSGLDFCHGCWSEMGQDTIEPIRYFGRRGQIVYVHFRDVLGTPENFRECFIDEGQCDMFEVMKTLKEVGFDGLMIPDHVPHMVADTDWDHRGRAYAIGYMTALLERVNAPG
ncbi:MAG: mannonate dehydratase [Candidatus Latescibacterota bacterium]